VASPSRPLHALERAWLVAERVQPGFVISLVVEGEGRIEADALAAALPLHPGMAGRVVGALGWCRVVCDRPPRIATQEGPLDPLRGPSAEIVVQAGRLVFRAHHAIADARAIQRWAEDCFACLRGEEVPPTPVLPAPPGIPGDWVAVDQPALLGPLDPDAPWGTHHAHIRVTTAPKLALRRVLDALWARRPGGRISVPVDLRSPGQPSDGNLTGIAMVSRPEELSGLRERCTRLFSLVQPLRWIPLGLLGRRAIRDARQALREDRYSAMATVSNVGRVWPERLSCPGFQATGAWWIPPGNVSNPFFMLMSGDAEGIDLSVAVPHAAASPRRLADLLGELADDLRRAG